MKKHTQYNQASGVQFIPLGTVEQDFSQSPSSIRTFKSISVKSNLFADERETIFGKGQKFRRTPFLTTAGNAVYSVSAQDFLLAVTGLAGAASVGLPLPSIVGNGKHYIIKDEAGGAATTTITVRSEGEKNIDGASTSTITTNYGSKEFYTDGANWFTK